MTTTPTPADQRVEDDRTPRHEGESSHYDCRLRRLWPLISFCALATMAATALAATAHPGWEVRQIIAHGPLTGTETARHCGAGRFGMYTIRDRERYKSGDLKGKTVHLVVKVDLRDDHRRHRFRFVSVAGTAITSMSRAARRKLGHALAAQYTKYSIEVLDSIHGLGLKTQLWLKGKVVSTGYVKLRKTRC